MENLAPLDPEYQADLLRLDHDVRRRELYAFRFEASRELIGDTETAVQRSGVLLQHQRGINRVLRDISRLTGSKREIVEFEREVEELEQSVRDLAVGSYIGLRQAVQYHVGMDFITARVFRVQENPEMEDFFQTLAERWRKIRDLIPEYGPPYILE